MKYLIYYAVYDISDNSRRESVVQILKDAALERVQKSVFCGRLSRQEKKDLLEKIKYIINKEDSFYLLMNCNQCFKQMVVLGKKFNAEYVANEKPAMVL